MDGTAQAVFRNGDLPAVEASPVVLLIVEPDQGVREALEEAFHVEGFLVCSVDGRAAALRVLQSRRFDYALVDVGSEGQGGLKLLQELRRFPGTRLGAMSVRSGLSMEARVHGADRFWVKPLAPGEVAEWMRPGRLEARDP